MRRWNFAAACFGLFLLVKPLHAQSPLSFGVAGGLSLPEGDLAEQVNSGWHALAIGELSSPMHPWGVRLDVAYSRFGFSDEVQSIVGGEGHQSTGSATLNFVYRLPKATSPIQPYLILGLGAYRTDCSLGPGCESRVRYGWNYGLGAKFFFLGLRNFVEVRGHRTKSRIGDVHYFPLTVGIMF